MANDFTNFSILGDEFLPGNKLQLKLSLLALILNRNVLIEDVPGMGKTTLVKFFAKSFGLDFKRIQFTSDLLPSDILGISVFQKETEEFIFRPGPVFGELILADELNRGTPKVQSALLEAMEEKQVTIDSITHRLPGNFALFATQNPRGQYGTYPLPESQLDRFLFKFPMGHLSRDEEVHLLATGTRISKLDSLKVILPKEKLTSWKKEISEIKTSKVLIEYLADLLKASRHRDNFCGLSPRAGLDLLDAAKAWAWLENRDYVIPDDIQIIFPYVAGHRLFAGRSLSTEMEILKAKELLNEVSIINRK